MQSTTHPQTTDPSIAALALLALLALAGRWHATENLPGWVEACSQELRAIPEA